MLATEQDFLNSPAYDMSMGIGNDLLPFNTPQVFTCMLWHRRYYDLPAHRWLRTLVRRIARTV